MGRGRAARPLIDARVFRFIAQRIVRSDFPQAGRNAHRIDRVIIAELLRVSLLSWERHEDAARWMERTIADAVKQRLCALHRRHYGPSTQDSRQSHRRWRSYAGKWVMTV